MPMPLGYNFSVTFVNNNMVYLTWSRTSIRLSIRMLVARPKLSLAMFTSHSSFGLVTPTQHRGVSQNRV